MVQVPIVARETRESDVSRIRDRWQIAKKQEERARESQTRRGKCTDLGFFLTPIFLARALSLTRSTSGSSKCSVMHFGIAKVVNGYSRLNTSFFCTGECQNRNRVLLMVMVMLSNGFLIFMYYTHCH